MKKILSLILAAIMLMTAMPMAYAEGSKYEVGDIIQFGSYPQSEVTDEALIAELDTLAPEWEDWTSYGYSLGESLERGDWMRYTDIVYKDNKYRGVKFTIYRPYVTNGSAQYTWQDDNYYYKNTIYWFKFDPIDWRVLDPDTGFVMCEKIIDSQPYSNTLYYKDGSYYNDSSYTNYAGDYETSSIRQWLNNDFYNTAFSDNEKEKINTTTLNNDSVYSLRGGIGSKIYDSNPTNDKIFILSIDQIFNSKYGFNSGGSDTARQAKGSDYAKSQGLCVISPTSNYGPNNSYWLLRSPSRSSYEICVVKPEGYFSYELKVSMTDMGVRPALCFNDIENYDHQHTYNAAVTKQPTHLTEGVETFTCECGDSYTEAITKTPEHTYTSEVSKEVTHLAEGEMTFTCACGDSYIIVIPKLTAHSYNAVVTAPTCEDKGFTTYTCECGDTYDADYVDENGHSYTSEITTPATHLAEGVETFTCHCGDTYTKSVAKLAEHTYTSEVTKEATHLEEGEMTYTCACNDSYTEVIAKIPEHTYTSIVTKEATHLEEGEMTYACACNDSYTEVIAKTPEHTYTSEVTKEATHLAEGAETFTCACGDTYTKAIAKTLEHTFQASKITEPTCEKTGYTTYICACGDSYKDNFVAEKGHSYNGQICTTCGKKCSCNCHKSGFMGFIWKITLFFSKLFKTKKMCACGIAHY